uniref:ParB domain-containing protein n=1 Tax=Panagrellus redivivus TaxID=6233 RepID=A0A7E4VZ87_PANRE
MFRVYMSQSSNDESEDGLAWPPLSPDLHQKENRKPLKRTPKVPKRKADATDINSPKRTRTPTDVTNRETEELQQINTDEESISNWFTIQSEALKLSRNLEKGVLSDLSLTDLRLSNLYRQVYPSRVNEIKQVMRDKQWQFKRTVLIVSHTAGSKTYSIEDGAHRFLAMSELISEHDTNWESRQRVQCMVYENLTDEQRYALIPDLTRADKHLPLRFVDDIELIRQYNASHGMTSKRAPWSAIEATKFYDNLLGNKKQSEFSIIQKIKLACLPEADWTTIKQYLVAFQDNQINFVPPRSHPEMNRQYGYRDLNNIEFWKRFQKQYERNPAQTVAAFGKVDGAFRDYDTLDELIRNGISKFLGKLSAIGFEYSSIEDVFDELVKASSVTVMDLKWISDFVDVETVLRATRKVQFVVMVSIDGLFSRPLWEHKANGLLPTPTLRLNLLLKSHAELRVNNVYQNTMDVWVYIRNQDLLCPKEDVEEALKEQPLSTTMKPREFAVVLKTLLSWKFAESIPRMLIIPPLVGLEDFAELFKGCIYPADLIYINTDHRDRMNQCRK